MRGRARRRGRRRAGREALTVIVAAMTVPNLLDRLSDGALLITPGDRADVLLTALFAHASRTLPSVAGVVLTGGLRPPDALLQPIDAPAMPAIVATAHDTYGATALAGSLEGAITVATPRKITTALALFEQHVDADALLERLEVSRSDAVTPLMFEHDLLDRARADRKHIVLPEGGDERILRAAEIAAPPPRRRPDAARRRAGDPGRAPRELGLDISGAGVSIPPTAGAARALRRRSTPEQRAHKGMTRRRRPRRGHRRLVLRHDDGRARARRRDGVRRDAHDGAHDPPRASSSSRRGPGVSIVSSVFLMCLDRPRARLRRLRGQPRPERRAARRHRDLLGGDRRRVRHRAARRDAVLLDRRVRARAPTSRRCARRPSWCASGGPTCSVEGPIQYDAAVDASVAPSKLPGQRRGRPGDGVHLPRPQHRQQHLQGRAAHRRRGGDRAGAAGAAQAGQRPVARRHGRRTSSTRSRSRRSRPSSWRPHRERLSSSTAARRR